MPYRVEYSISNSDRWMPIYPDWEDGSRAGQAMARYRCRYPSDEGYRWRIRKVRDDGLPDDWREREQARFDNGTYKAVPWADAEWYQPYAKEHFCHISLDDVGKIAYTEDEKKGEADRQTRISPGRYLRKFFENVLTAEDIERLACEVSVLADECGLHITQDADEIEDVYVNGPRSCMAYSEDAYQGPCHPVRVYAGPDLALAYTGSRDNASGRCIVWPEKKRHSTIYGDCTRMRMLLKAAGYEEDDLHGARVRKISAGRGFVMPYVDDVSGATDTGEFITLDGGYLDTKSTEGTTHNENYAECDRCGGEYDPDDEGYYMETLEETWCNSCGAHHSTYCELSDQQLPDADHTFVEVNTITRYTRWDYSLSPPQLHRTHTHTTVTACDDHEDVIYVEDRDEYWTQEAIDLCKAIEGLATSIGQPEFNFGPDPRRSAAAKKGWETRRLNMTLALAA